MSKPWPKRSAMRLLLEVSVLVEPGKEVVQQGVPFKKGDCRAKMGVCRLMEGTRLPARAPSSRCAGGPQPVLGGASAHIRTAEPGVESRDKWARVAA